MDYTKLSDHEINKLVAHQLGYTEQGEGWIDNADGIYWYILDPKEGYRYSLPNYCKSWAEAGPIIEKESICLQKETDICCSDCCEVFERDNWEASHAIENIWFDDPNPVRAAMIVFLKLKGVV